MVSVKSQRLVIRRFHHADVEPMLHVFGDPEVMRFGRGVQAVDWVKTWIDRTIETYDLWGFGLWATVPHEMNTPVGYCGLTRFDDINGRPEIELGYRLARAFWGSGLATEGATAVRDVAFGQLGLRRLVSLIDPDNWRSIRVAEKIGMVYTDDVVLPGYTHADRVYLCERDGQQRMETPPHSP